MPSTTLLLQWSQGDASHIQSSAGSALLNQSLINYMKNQMAQKISKYQVWWVFLILFYLEFQGVHWKLLLITMLFSERGVLHETSDDPFKYTYALGSQCYQSVQTCSVCPACARLHFANSNTWRCCLTAARRSVGGCGPVPPAHSEDTSNRCSPRGCSSVCLPTEVKLLWPHSPQVSVKDLQVI